MSVAYQFLTWSTSTQRTKRVPSDAASPRFLSVAVGASFLEISETSGKFDFGNKILSNVAAGTASGQVLIFDQVGAANGVASLDANGLVPVSQMPPAALERLVIVANQAARFALTTATVQNGDTVKQTDNDTMYFVKDDSNLGNASGYETYSAGTSVNFSGNLSGEVTGTQSTTVLGTTAVTGKLLTGISIAAGIVSASDSILSAIGKLAGNSNTAATKSLTNDNGSAITAGQIVYIKSNGNVDLAQANVSALDDAQLGVVKDASIASAASGYVYVKDGEILSGFSGLTPGALVYVSRSSAGGTTQSLSGFVATEHVYAIGRAVSATEIAFDPEYMFEY